MDRQRNAGRRRCGPCWRFKKGCDGNEPFCHRCELSGRDCDWPEDAQYRLSPTKFNFQNSFNSDFEQLDSDGPAEMTPIRTSGTHQSVVDEPAPQTPNLGEFMTLNEDRKDFNNAAGRMRIVNPEIQQIMCKADLDVVEKFHKDFVQAQKDYMSVARTCASQEEMTNAHAGLIPFDRQFERVGKQYEQHSGATNNVVDNGAQLQLIAINLPWDKWQKEFDNDTDGIETPAGRAAVANASQEPVVDATQVPAADTTQVLTADATQVPAADAAHVLAANANGGGIANGGFADDFGADFGIDVDWDWDWDWELEDTDEPLAPAFLPMLNLDFNWNVLLQTDDELFNPALPPMIVDHHDVLNPLNTDIAPREPGITNYYTIAGVAADGLFAGERYEAPEPNEFDAAFEATEVPQSIEAMEVADFIEKESGPVDMSFPPIQFLTQVEVEEIL